MKSLTAAFCRWKVGAETVELYVEKLSKWHLSPDQWARALSRIVADLPDSEFPTLGVIYGYLKTAQFTGHDSNKAWMCYRVDGKAYAVRIEARDGKWIYAPMETKDSHGEMIQLQKHPGADAVYPNGAVDCRVTPDREYQEGGACSPPEAREAFRSGYIEAGGDFSRIEEFHVAAETKELGAA